MQTQPDIALVAIDSDTAQGLAMVARVTQELPTCSVLVVMRLDRRQLHPAGDAQRGQGVPQLSAAD